MTKSICTWDIIQQTNQIIHFDYILDSVWCGCDLDLFNLIFCTWIYTDGMGSVDIFVKSDFPLKYAERKMIF